MTLFHLGSSAAVSDPDAPLGPVPAAVGRLGFGLDLGRRLLTGFDKGLEDRPVDSALHPRPDPHDAPGSSDFFRGLSLKR
jgi:hypothetical protein